MNPETTGIKPWQWTVTAIVIVVLIIVGVKMFGGKSDISTDIPVVDTSGGSTNEVNRIVMADQYPGNVVYVSSVQLANDGFVVIHANNNGQPGAVLGSAFLAKGVNPARITLTSPMVDGSSYFAVLYSDNGDKSFNASQDLPIKDSRGNIIMRLFRASTEAGVEFKG